MTNLAPYACHPDQTRGRRHVEPAPLNRSEYQRDRDRIIHAKAFRRLQYKTQVFVNHEGDWFRTRLTHTLEVTQIARVIARSLGLDEDLTEAIALAHDLGHTPFGHAGQDELNACMREFAPDEGGFEHNLQSLRVVDQLEQRYPAFSGLNLCFETREGILKHCSQSNAKRLGDVGERFILRKRPSLEAQLANLADEIAYNNHDIDDGLQSGLLTLDQLMDVEIFREHYTRVQQHWPGLESARVTRETIRQMINTLIMDVTQTSQRNLARLQPTSVDDVRECPVIIQFSDELHSRVIELKSFLLKYLYRHYRVARMSRKARKIIRDLFTVFFEEPILLPTDYRRESDREKARAIADYIAGMTDRYAIREHRRIFEMEEKI